MMHLDKFLHMYTTVLAHGNYYKKKYLLAMKVKL